MILTARARPTRRLLVPFVLTSVVTLGVTGCASDSNGTGSSGSSNGDTAADTGAAGEVLDAGLEAHAAGDLTAAAQKYEETLTIDPTNKFAHYNLALIDEARSNYGLAEEKYRQALDADPAYEPALFNLAILVTTRDPEEAVSLYERAVEADRTDASAWMNLGLLQRAAGDAAAGNKSVTTAIELNPELTDPHRGPDPRLPSSGRSALGGRLPRC